jgi:hypothetical protein
VYNKWNAHDCGDFEERIIENGVVNRDVGLVDQARLHLAGKTNAFYRSTIVRGSGRLCNFCEGNDLALLFVALPPIIPLAVCGAVVRLLAATAALECLPTLCFSLASSTSRGIS